MSTPKIDLHDVKVILSNAAAFFGVGTVVALFIFVWCSYCVGR